MGRPKAGQYQDTFKRANQMWRANGSPPGRMKEYLGRRPNWVIAKSIGC